MLYQESDASCFINVVYKEKKFKSIDSLKLRIDYLQSKSDAIDEYFNKIKEIDEVVTKNLIYLDLSLQCESVIKCLNIILKEWSVLNRLFEEIESVFKNFNAKQNRKEDTHEFSLEQSYEPIERKLDECEKLLNKIKDYLDSSLYEINENKLRELKLVYSKMCNLNDSYKNSNESNDLKEKNLNKKSECSNSNFELMNEKPSFSSLNEVNSNTHAENQVNTTQYSNEFQLKNEDIEIELINPNKEIFSDSLRERFVTTKPVITTDKNSDALLNDSQSKSSMLEFIAYFLLLVYILMLCIMVI